MRADLAPCATHHAGATPAADPPALRLQGVAKHFGAFQALTQVDLEIARGELVCFLGPSGCGKTTLLRIIAGLEQPSAGRLWQAGRDITRLAPGQRDYGLVFQSYALFPNLNAADNVAYGLGRRGQARVRARVDELLALVGLAGCSAKYPAQLSGGQQQRVALARALATNPGLLLLDEPLSALDATVRAHLRRELRALQQRLGVTTIMVTHDQEEALSLADRIVVMNHGVIEQVGSPRQVYLAPASAFVAEFIGRANRLQAVVQAGGGLRCGALSLPAPPGAPLPAGQAVTAFLRPEDHWPEGAAPGQGWHCLGTVSQVEFLGGSCQVAVEVAGLHQGPLQLQYTPHQLQALDIAPGRRLQLALRTERLRVFATPGRA
ncbi:MAG: putative 2-aminoethylphosphonate ABC transporter ATP-binding protein [Proteobacteria bacterium]|nr:putative 2-aminoethylphosphonate ABC transporter ATP-binding protein [Pseudomonadota bacterium]